MLYFGQTSHQDTQRWSGMHLPCCCRQFLQTPLRRKNFTQRFRGVRGDRSKHQQSCLNLFKLAESACGASHPDSNAHLTPHHPENCGLYKIRRLGWRRLRQLAKRLSRTPAHPLSSPKIAAYTEFAGRAGEGLRKPSPTISPNTNLQTSNCTENNYVFCTSSKNSRYLYAWRYQ